MQQAHQIAFGLVMLAWAGFALVFLARRRPTGGEVTRSAPQARLGVLLQAVAYALVWSMRRAPWSPLVDWPGVDLLAIAVAPLLAFGSAWLTLAAVRTLGRQWSVEARLVEGHRLVTDGPYALVRHPIYSAMGGLLVATGLVQSQAWVLPPGIVLFVAGTLLRTRAEEGLMREAFGSEFEAYARRVPALLPLPR